MAGLTCVVVEISHGRL